MKIDLNDRVKGTLMGLAVGDALGYGTEFMPKTKVCFNYPDGLKRYSDIVESEWCTKDHIGHWTDDTDMMLAILDSLLDKKEIDLADIAKNFKAWKESSPWDIGMLTSDVLSNPKYLDDPVACAKKEWENSGRNSAGNGGIMRTSITAIWQYKDWKQVKENTANICRLTHYDPRCVSSCVVVAYIIHSILNDKTFTKRDLIEVSKEFDERTGKFIEIAYQPDITRLSLDGPGMGYTLKAMAAGIWAFNYAKDYMSGIQTVLLEGGDADTNCAVAGPILGAKYGFSSIPKHLITDLKEGKALEHKIDRLIKML